jgi:uncharacterized membrane protein
MLYILRQTDNSLYYYISYETNVRDDKINSIIFFSIKWKSLFGAVTLIKNIFHREIGLNVKYYFDSNIWQQIVYIFWICTSVIYFIVSIWFIINHKDIIHKGNVQTGETNDNKETANKKSSMLNIKCLLGFPRFWQHL